jgi:3-oxoadipate enol-lactonase
VSLRRWDPESGQRTAVVLLHGVGGGAAAWEPNGRAIADAGFVALAPDLPGYGDAPTIDPCDMAGMAASVCRLLDEWMVPAAVLVGHSMGGMVAQEVLALAPHRVLGLVVSGASPAFGKPGGDWQRRFLADRFSTLDAGHGMAELASRLVPGMVAPGAGADAVRFATDLMAAVPESTYRRALSAIVGFDRRGDLARIAVPTLCLAGAHDRNAPPSMVQQMALRIRGAEYLCLTDAGHLANIEQPAAFNRALVSFLNRHFKD